MEGHAENIAHAAAQVPAEAAEAAAHASHAGGEVVGTLMALLVVAILVGTLASRLRFPYAVSLVVVGIALRAIGVAPDMHLTHDLLMNVLLPALLFEAAIHVPGNKLRRFAPTVVMLAVPGVLLAAFGTAFLLEVELVAFGLNAGIPFVELLLFGAVIAATDPIAVIALFKALGVDKKLAILVEGESLFNDGTAIVMFTIVLEVIRSGTFTVGGALTSFAIVVGGGILIGAAVGLLASWATSLIDDHLFEIALTVVTAYGAFLIGEQLHVSGVLATVVAGLLVGNVGKKRNMSPYSRVSVLSFWEFAAFFINTLVFLLLGFEVDYALLVDKWNVILLAFFAVLGARALAVYGPLPVLRRLHQPVDTKVATVFWWGAMRGSLSVVLALALPLELSARNEIIAMVFGVVVLSLVVQGSTMSWLLRKLGLVQQRTEAMQLLGNALARMKAVHAQEAALDDLVAAGALNLPAIDERRERLRKEREELQARLSARGDDPAMREAVERHAAVIDEHLRHVAVDAYRKALDENLIDGSTAAKLIAGEDPVGIEEALEGPVGGEASEAKG